LAGGLDSTSCKGTITVGFPIHSSLNGISKSQEWQLIKTTQHSHAVIFIQYNFILRSVTFSTLDLAVAVSLALIYFPEALITGAESALLGNSQNPLQLTAQQIFRPRTFRFGKLSPYIQ
jgi:hypothetical protein